MIGGIMNERKFFSNIGMAYFLLLLVTGAVQIILSVIITKAAPQLFDISIIYWAVSLAPMYLVGMPICVKMMKRLPAVRLYETKMKFGRWFVFLCMCMFIMYAGNLIGNGVSALISHISGLDLSLALQDMMMNESGWTTFLFSVILAPVLEELIFRKVLIDRTIVFGDKTAIVLSGILFGLFHGNFYQLFYAFGLGCMLAYLYIRTGKVQYTISIHMAINLLGGFLPTLLMKNLNLDVFTGNMQMGEMMYYLFDHMGTLILLIIYELLLLAMVIAGLVLFLLSVKKRELRTGEYGMPAGETARVMFGNIGMILFVALCVVLFITNMLS